MKKVNFTPILILLAFVITAFIFSNSARDALASDDQSSAWIRILQYFFDRDRSIGDHVWRKIAHFVEFFVLGFCLGWLTVSMHRNSGRYHLMLPMFICLSAAVIDETIQYFSLGRSPEVKDILIDFSGSVTAMAAVVIIVSAVAFIKKKKTAKNN